jgi:hypothetical protein
MMSHGAHGVLNVFMKIKVMSNYKVRDCNGPFSFLINAYDNYINPYRIVLARQVHEWSSWHELQCSTKPCT